MLTIIALPGNFVASTTGFMSDFVTDLNPYTTLVLGVLLGTTVIIMIIHAIRG